MAQEPESHRYDPTTETYRAPADGHEPERPHAEQVLDDLSGAVDRTAAGGKDDQRQHNVMQPVLWTMMLLVALLGAWTLFVQEPPLQPEPLNLDSFRATPEILQVNATPPDISAQISFNRWMKMMPEAQIRLVEDISRIASAGGYRSVTLVGTEGTRLAQWLQTDGVQILYPEPESVSVQLP